MALKPVDKTKRKHSDKISTRGATPDRYKAFLTGEITVEDLDDEEIMRGQIRSADGSFRGRPPKLVPREFAAALAKRQQEMYNGEMGELVVEAWKTLNSVMKNRNPLPGEGARVQAAKLILERYYGKTPDVVVNTTQSEWEEKLKRPIKIEREYLALPAGYDEDGNKIEEAEIVE